MTQLTAALGRSLGAFLSGLSLGYTFMNISHQLIENEEYGMNVGHFYLLILFADLVFVDSVGVPKLNTEASER